MAEHSIKEEASQIFRILHKYHVNQRQIMMIMDALSKTAAGDKVVLITPRMRGGLATTQKAYNEILELLDLRECDHEGGYCRLVTKRNK